MSDCLDQKRPDHSEGGINVVGTVSAVVALLYAIGFKVWEVTQMIDVDDDLKRYIDAVGIASFAVAYFNRPVRPPTGGKANPLNRDDLVSVDINELPDQSSPEHRQRMRLRDDI